MTTLEEKGQGTPSGAGERKTVCKARRGKGHQALIKAISETPKQEGTNGGQSYVEVLTQAGQKETKRRKTEGTGEGQVKERGY